MFKLLTVRCIILAQREILLTVGLSGMEFGIICSQIEITQQAGKRLEVILIILIWTEQCIPANMKLTEKLMILEQVEEFLLAGILKMEENIIQKKI